VAPLPDLGDLALRLAAEVGHTRRLGDLEDVDPVVRDAPTLGGREFGGPDIHAAVLLHRVAVDHLPAQPLGQIEGEVGLPGPRRPNHRDGRGPAHVGPPGVGAAGDGRSHCAQW
jgi:hypothetical protein